MGVGVGVPQLLTNTVTEVVPESPLLLPVTV